MNTLSSSCYSWMLKINPKTPKIVIFQKCKRKWGPSFYICNEKIDIVQNYTFLGTCISSTGNFTLSLDHLRQKALHALFSLRRKTVFKSLKPSRACKIFDSMISPILTYNNEVWGTFVQSNFKSWKTLQSKKLIYCSLNDIWNCVTKRQIWQGEIKILCYLSYLQDKDDKFIQGRSPVLGKPRHSPR